MAARGFRTIKIDSVKYKMMTIDGYFQGFWFNNNNSFLSKELIETALHIFALNYLGDQLTIKFGKKTIPKKTFELLHNFANLKIDDR